MNKRLSVFLIFTLVTFLIAVQLVRASSGLIENSWVKKTSLPQGGAVFGAGVVGGKIYAFGGYYYFNSTDSGTHTTSGEYDPATDTWTKIAPMPTKRIDFATAVYENKIYIIGGHKYPSFPALNVVEVYDPATNKWTTAAPMPAPRAYMQANVVNDKIYVISGSTVPTTGDILGGAVNTTQVYDPRLNSWSMAASIPEPVARYVSAVVDDKIYVMGGGTPSGSFGTTQIYDPATDEWTFGAPSPIAFIGAVGGATTGAMAPKGIYVFGGFNGYGNPSLLNQVCDPETNSWTTGAEMPEYDYGYSAVAVLNDTLYVMGGTYSSVGPDLPLLPYDNPPPPFDSFNYQYIPFGYGTFNPIPTPSPSPSPTPTGSDSSSLVTVIVLVAITCALVATIVIKRRKRRS